MQSSCNSSICRNLLGLTLRKPFLKPNQSSHNVMLVAGKKRAPPRFLGFTKSQVFDTLYRTHATIAMAITGLTIPLVLFMMYRYNVVLKPEIEAHKKQEEESLLAEGAFQKS